ncbi:MAG: sel1 repeat family protein [Hyphomicrobiales bacterium]|nr:sel1 repeat family protein [Hyphomicrobiales bacterium]
MASSLTDAYNAYINGDFATALRIITPLAEKGDAEAQFVLGYMYETGHVAPQNSIEAAKWFRRAADSGDTIAQISLGRLYEKGKGVPQDYAEAKVLYAKAAAKGSARGHFRLAGLYRFGLGMPQDLVQAHMHFNLAAAGFTILPARETRDEIAKSMTAAQLSEARRLAREWITAHPPQDFIDPSDKSEE